MAEFEFSKDWGYSEKERATARATALRIIAEAHGQTLASQLPAIIEWYAGSPHEEDARELLDALHERLWNANDSLPDPDYEDEEEYEKAWEDATVDTDTVITILDAVRDFVPMEFIAANSYTIERMADEAAEYYRKASESEVLNSLEEREFRSSLAYVAGLADYFDGGGAPMRSDAMEFLMQLSRNDETIRKEIAQAFEDGLAYDRRAGTLRERLPWLRWFFDQIPEDEFWRGVFASNPAPLAAGFQYLVWMGDATMEDKTRAMWYSYLGDLARLGVRLEPDDVLHLSRSSELMGRLLCQS
jgi:hypothetical protein